MSHSHTPTYNLKAVIKATGIAADTLRAWERRYGMPLPQRTLGGHRLYSEHDIATIKWLASRQKLGLSISHAVDLWNELSGTGRNPLAESQPDAMTPPPVADLESARQAWVSACLAFNETASEQALNQAFAIHSVEFVVGEVLLRGFFEIGELWIRDEASVQQEHFASGLAMRRLDALLCAAPLPTRPETMLVACPPEELHVFPLLVLALFLRRRGWNVINLGGSVPLDRMEEAVRSIQPNLVVLAAQQLTTALTLQAMAQLLQNRGVQVAFGGRIFNQLTDIRDRIPAHWLGASIEAGLQMVESLAVRPVPAPLQKTLSEAEARLAESYTQNRQAIEQAAVRILRDRKRDFEQLPTANHFLGNLLAAALQLGSPSYLKADIDWLRNLLAPREIPTLPHYLEAYEQALQQVLGAQGATIIQWIQSYRQDISVAPSPA